MRFTQLLVVGILAGCFVPAQAITIIAYQVLVPVYGPDKIAFEQNAVQGLLSGLTSFGTPGTPSYFFSSPTVSVGDLVVCGFACWKGDVNPASPYASERGTTPGIAFAINGNGAKISASELNFLELSSPNTIDLSSQLFSGQVAMGFGNVSGVAGQNGTGALVTTGANTALFDKLYGVVVGVGVSTDCTTPDKQCGVASGQIQAILNAEQKISSVTAVSDTITVVNSGNTTLATSTRSFDVVQTPEPATSALLILGLMAILKLAGRRKQE